MNQTKLCVDCKFHETYHINRKYKEHTCSRFKQKEITVDPVTGEEKIHIRISNEVRKYTGHRQTIFNSDVFECAESRKRDYLCGPEGRFFETAKEPSPISSTPEPKPKLSSFLKRLFS